MTANREYYGPHLMLDGWDGCYTDLRDEGRINLYLRSLAHLMGMRILIGPFCVQVWPDQVQDPDDWGLTGFVVIAESHLSVHTYPNDCSAMIDVFSCREFDFKMAVDYTQKMFSFKNIDQTVQLRGYGFHDRRQQRKVCSLPGVK